MKRSALLVLPLLCAPLATLWAVPEHGGEPAASSRSQDEATPLQEAMGSLKNGQRGLKKLIGDPAANQQALIELLGSMEEACLIAIGSELPLPDEITGDRAALLKVGFRSTLADLLKQVLVMHEAALKQDKAALETGYRELGALKKVGHDRYSDL
jgi:hypothetical protein